MTKHCNFCKNTKELTEFPKNKSKCKNCTNSWRRDYYQKNREMYLSRELKYRSERSEKIKISKESGSQEYLVFKEMAKKRYLRHREKISQRSKKYYESHKEEIYQYSTEYRSKNRKKLNAYHNNRRQKKYQVCPKFNLITKLRARTAAALKSKNIKKTKRVLDFLGCTVEHLKNHIECLFLEGMTWENKGQWHIDHIIPISSGNTEEDILKLNHYTNLQPLWAQDNLKKGSKVTINDKVVLFRKGEAIEIK